MTGAEIRTLRHQLAIKQQSLAQAIGVSVATISRWEKEEGKPSDTQQRQLDALYRLVNNNSIDRDRLKESVSLLGISATIAIAIMCGITIGGALAGTISGFVKDKDNPLKKEN